MMKAQEICRRKSDGIKYGRKWGGGGRGGGKRRRKGGNVESIREL